MKKKKTGFTLIELLIVLVVIGLIGSVAYPSFSNIQVKAKERNVEALVHTIQVSLESYYLDQGSYPAGKDTTIDALAKTLKTSGSYNKTPINPFTGAAYTDKDASGKIAYTYDSKTNVYTITGYGLGNSAVIVTADNQ